MKFSRSPLDALVGGCLIFFFSLEPVYAGFFVGADATAMRASIAWTIPKINQNFELNPVRARIGYQGETFGFEVQAFSAVEDIAVDNGFVDKLEIAESFGLYLRAQEKWVYAKLGVTLYNTIYTDTLTGVSDSDRIGLPTLVLGIEYPLTRNIGINLDYSYGEARSQYYNITSGPVPTLKIYGAALGLTIKF